MNLEEYKTALNKLLKRFEAEKNRLVIKYVLDNNPVKIGDIVTDHCHTIKVEHTKVYYSFDKPSCVYTGIELNKDGNPKKRQENTNLFQGNLEFINGEKYEKN